MRESGRNKGQSLGVAHCTSTMQSTEPGGQVCTCPCHTAVRGTEWLEDRSSMPRGLAWQGRHGTARCGGRGVVDMGAWARRLRPHVG